ncbi:MAG: BMC domain-containing protein [Epulopiscium sp.]|nr:BMC domain-containing protein [Candidatus Epulonipiscium sp.]
MSAIGIIEVSGLTNGIQSLDIMLKTAQVEFVTYEKRLGGRLVTIVVKGDIGAVQASVESAVEQDTSLGNIVAHAVIPNPHGEVMKIIGMSADKLQFK